METAARPTSKHARARNILLWMLLGVIVNLGVVAWATGFAGPIRLRALSPAERRAWPAYAPDIWPSPTDSRAWRGWTRSIVTYEHAIPGRSFSIVRTDYGFPFRAMQIHRFRGLPSPDDRERWNAAAGIYRGFNLNQFASTRRQSSYFIPVVPIVGGFIINSLFYTALLWFLARIGWRLYDRLRVPEGHCRRCRYDLLGLDEGAPCPECGTPIPSMAPTPT